MPAAPRPSHATLAATVAAIAAAMLVPAPTLAQGSDPLPRRALWRAVVAPAGGDSGVVVRRVDAGSPAERAGLRAGDRVVALDGAPLASADAYPPLARRLRGGDTARLVVRRAGAAERVSLAFVLDTLPRETIPGATSEYGAVRSPRGYRVRTVVNRPLGAGRARLPAVLVIPWLSCDPVEKPDPGSDGIAHTMRDVAARAGVLLARVEKPGVGDSEGPACGDAGLDDELDAYRAALAALRARPDVDTARLFLLGISIGGGIAPVLAAEDPRGVAGVIAAGGFTRTWYEHMLDIERRRLTLGGRPAAEVSAGMRALAGFYVDYLVARRTPAEALAARPDARPFWDDEPARQYGRPAAYYHGVQRLDVEGAWAALADRGVPALVVWGEYDWIMGRDEADRAVAVVNARRPGAATLSVVPRAGHGLMTFASLADAFAYRSPRWDGVPGRVIVDWLRARAVPNAPRSSP